MSRSVRVTRAAGVQETLCGMAVSPVANGGGGDGTVEVKGRDCDAGGEEMEIPTGTCLQRAFPFVPGMSACFADYLGMAMLTPALPYFLADLGYDAKQVATWTGAITTAQYAGAACGNMVVGAMGDSLGSRLTLSITLVGDVALFALTAFTKNVGALTTIRCFAGLSSPLVASLHYILRSAKTKAQTLEGVNAYSVSVNIGYACGGVIVGVAYDGLGWVGINVLSAIVAGIALIVVLILVKDDRLVKKDKVDTGITTSTAVVMEKGSSVKENTKNKESNFSVYQTGAMVSHMITAINVGYQFMGFLVLFTLMAKQILGWSPSQIGWSFMAIPIANTVAMYYFIPPLIRKFGVHSLITYSSFATMVTLGAFALPAVHESPAGIMTITFCLILCVVTVQVPNQMRIKIISDQYAPTRMGKITGASRVCFAFGQTLSPIACAVLYTVHPSLAIGSMFVSVSAVPLAFFVCGQSYFEDPVSNYNRGESINFDKENNAEDGANRA